jgi:hypothetical protein
MAVGSRHPPAPYRYINPILTSYMQGVKRPNSASRPLAPSTSSNQASKPTMMASMGNEAYKVCHSPSIRSSFSRPAPLVWHFQVAMSNDPTMLTSLEAQG